MLRASALALLAGLVSNRALAADAPPPADESTGIQDVEVTAQRRSESARDVPTTVYSLGGDLLGSADQVQRTNDITQFIPNAESVTAGGPILPRWFIRGLGTNRQDFNTITPTAVYQDDIYLGNAINQTLPLFDVSRVQVLVGPQGTLWGKAANGGAVDTISAPVTFKQEGYARAGYGSYNTNTEEVVYNAPLVGDKLAGRVSVYNTGTDGWQTNVFNNETAGTRDSAGRGQLLFLPSDDVTLTLNLHGRDYDGVPRSFQFVPDSNSKGSTAQTNYLTVYPQGYPQTKYGNFDFAQSGRDSISELGSFLKGKWEPGYLTLESITGYEKADRISTGSTSGPATSTISADNPATLNYTRTNYWQLSQEFRIASPVKDFLTWQVGTYNYYEGSTNVTATSNLNKTSSTLPSYTNVTNQQDKESYAFFGSTAIHATEDLTINNGVRWTDERIKYTNWYHYSTTAPNGANFYDVNAPLTNASEESNNWQSWTYDASPEYRLTNNVNVYVRYAHGVTPGGYTTTGFLGTGVGYAGIYDLKPETIDSYEGGLKTQWLDKRLNLNATVFQNNLFNTITNVPTIIAGNSVVVFRNAGIAYSKGIELTAEAQPVKEWRFGVNSGFMDAKYVKEGASNFGLVGSDLPRTPHVTLNGYTSYEEKFPWGGDLVYAIDANWRSHQYFYPTRCSQAGIGCNTTSTTAADPLLGSRQYAIANLHFTWHPQDEKTQALELSVNNFTNTKYWEHALAVTAPYAERLPGEPLSVFVTFKQNL